MESRHRLDSDLQPELTELSPSETEDGDIGSGKQTPAPRNTNTANCARAVHIPASHQPTTASSPVLSNTGPEKCSSPASSNVEPEKRASPASSNTGAEKRTLSGALTACHQTSTGPDQNAATPALSKTGTPEHTGEVKPPCQILAATLRPEAWASVYGPSDTTLPPSLSSSSSLTTLSDPWKILFLHPQNNNTAKGFPNHVALFNTIHPPHNAILFRTILLIRTTLTEGNQPLDVYNIPISLPVLSLTSVTPQKPCIFVSADKPTSTPNQEFCQPHSNAGFVPMDLDVAEVPVDTDVVESPVEDINIAKSPVEDIDVVKSPVENIDVVKSPVEDAAKELKPHLTKTAEEPKPHSTEDLFQCLADDIEQAKLRLKTPALIAVKPYLTTNSIPLPHLNAVLETSTAANSLPTSSTASSPWNQNIKPLKPISLAQILPTNQPGNGKTDSMKFLKAAQSNTLAFPIVKVEDVRYTHSTDLPSCAQPAAVNANQPTNNSLPSSSPQHQNLKEDHYLEFPTAATSNVIVIASASALPNSSPPPQNVNVKDNGCTSPTNTPSLLPQLVTALEILTAANSNPPCQEAYHTQIYQQSGMTTPLQRPQKIQYGGGLADVPSVPPPIPYANSSVVHGYADATKYQVPLNKWGASLHATDSAPSERYHPLSNSHSPPSVQIPTSILASLTNLLEEEEDP
ncbi:hypothetical protein PSTT_13295 [Puccinia striiformis]|uniref:Uncharacterized protein n=1 Tax=Puccinia striiformis TaxID=27350 RepID=A0A2S4USI8_9BASI|nr:hypothetical protein PSTT_13295 [Puccinia striiformis]